MGYEIPAAIGVQQAAPGTPVWALVGDGTYLMMPTEIVTAVQEGLPVTVVLLQNHGYASIGGLSASVGAERFGTAYRTISQIAYPAIENIIESSVASGLIYLNSHADDFKAPEIRGDLDRYLRGSGGVDAERRAKVMK